MITAWLFALTLQEAWHTALLYNPQIQKAQEVLHQRETQIGFAYGDAYPSIELRVSYTGNRNPGFLNSKDFKDIVQTLPFEYKPQANYIYDTALYLTQKVFTGGKVKTGLQAARLARTAAENEAFQIRNQILRKIARVYGDLFLYKKQYQVLKAQKETQKVFLEQVKARWDVGDATQLELLKAKAELAALEPALVERESQIFQKKKELQNLMGTPDPIDDIADLPEITVTGNGETWFTYAKENHPEVLTLKFQKEETLLREKLVKAEGKPQVSLEGFWGRQVADPANLPDPLYNNWGFQLTASLSLFDGWQRHYLKEEQRSLRRQTQWEKRVVLNALKTRLSYLEKKEEAAMKKLQAQKLYLEQAQEARRTAEAHFQVGASTELEVLDAQRREREAQLDYLTALRQLYETRLDILYEAGFSLYEEGKP